MAKIDIGKLVMAGGAIANAIQNAADDSKTSLEQKDVPKVTTAVEAAVKSDIKGVQKELDARIDHLTNAEPWYQSRVTWGAVVAVVAGVAGVAGYSFDAEDQRVWIDSISQGVQLISAGVAVVGGILTWYGRWRAKKPIGE